MVVNIVRRPLVFISETILDIDEYGDKLGVLSPFPILSLSYL